MPTPTATTTKKADPAPPKQPHPTITGAAWFRTKDGWRAGRIITDDPSIFVELGPPNLKSIVIDQLKRHIVACWEHDS